MSGINIPSGALAKPSAPQGTKLARVFDKGLAFSIVLVIVVAGAWGVLWFLRFQIDRQITGYHTAVNGSLASVNQSDTAAVEDFATRAAISSDALKDRVNPLDTLALLEKDTSPQVTLSSFGQNATDGSITVSGITSDYRYLAEQVLRYRQEDALKDITVSSSSRNDQGQILFELAVTKPEVPTVPTEPANPGTI